MDSMGERNPLLPDAAESTFQRYVLSKRWHLAYIAFFGYFFILFLRVNLSVAVVCMVNSSTSDNTSSNHKEGEFHWDKSTTSSLLSAYFYGYFILQLPGGWLAGKFGGTRVISLSMLLSSILTLVLPLCARTNLVLLHIVRVLTGLSAGVASPAFQSMWGRWAPLQERTMLFGVTYTGGYLGSIAAFAVSGFLCDQGFAGGWPSIFYLPGALALLWTILWWMLIYDSPSKHPRISVAERDYITRSLGEKSQQTPSIPWRHIMTSLPFWSLVVAVIASGWIDYTFTTSLPQYLKDVLDYDITQNGVLSSVPAITQFASSLFCGHVADWMRSNRWSTRVVRNIFQTLTLLGIGGCLAGVGYIHQEHRMWAVALLGMSGFFAGLQQAGFMANFIDIAPRFAGVLYGTGNTLASISGIVSPLLVGALTKGKTREEWRQIFFICVGICVFAEVVYLLFSRGHVQEWAIEKESSDLESTQSQRREVTSQQHLQDGAPDFE